MSDKVLVVDYGRTQLRGYLLSAEAPEPLLAGSKWSAPSEITPANPSRAASRLLELASSLVADAGIALTDLSVAAAGLAGYGRAEDCRALERALTEKESPFPWLVESDAQQTLRAACEDGDVAVALLGTGSAFFARNTDGTVFRTGGHGALLEDHGSAFEISRQVILAMMRAYDGMGPSSRIFDTLLEEMDCENALEFRVKLMQAGFVPATWAKFAPIVLQLAEEGDLLAGKVLERELERVVDCLWAVIHKAGLPLGSPIFCAGGMVEKNPYYLQRILAATTKGLPDYPCQILTRDPYWGGWRLACQWLTNFSRIRTLIHPQNSLCDCG